MKQIQENSMSEDFTRCNQNFDGYRVLEMLNNQVSELGDLFDTFFITFYEWSQLVKAGLTDEVPCNIVVFKL